MKAEQKAESRKLKPCQILHALKQEAKASISLADLHLGSDFNLFSTLYLAGYHLSCTSREDGACDKKHESKKDFL